MKIFSCLVALFLVGCSSAAQSTEVGAPDESDRCKQPLGSTCIVDGTECFSYDVTGGTWAKCCANTLTAITYGPDAGGACPQ